MCAATGIFSPAGSLGWVWFFSSARLCFLLTALGVVAVHLDAHLDRPDRPVRQELRDLRAAEEQLLQMHEKSKALLASLQGLGL